MSTDTEQVTISRAAYDHLRVQISILKDDLHQALEENAKLQPGLGSKGGRKNLISAAIDVDKLITEAARFHPDQTFLPRAESALRELCEIIVAERQPRSAGATTEDPDEFYLQDSRGFVGNDMVFWAKEGRGYVTDLRLAEVFTRENAYALHRSRASDVPWPKAYIDSRARPAVDVQHVDREVAFPVQNQQEEAEQ